MNTIKDLTQRIIALFEKARQQFDDTTNTQTSYALLTAATVVIVALTTCLGVFIASNVNSNSPNTPSDSAVIIFTDDYGGEHTLNVELADSPIEYERGLMDRTYLPDDQAMLFVFPDEQVRTFWMKNTLISLDILYISSAGEVVSIYRNTIPNQTEVVYPSTSKAKYVLETNSGWSSRVGIDIGDYIQFLIKN